MLPRQQVTGLRVTHFTNHCFDYDSLHVVISSSLIAKKIRPDKTDKECVTYSTKKIVVALERVLKHCLRNYVSWYLCQHADAWRNQFVAEDIQFVVLIKESIVLLTESEAMTRAQMS